MLFQHFKVEIHLPVEILLQFGDDSKRKRTELNMERNIFKLGLKPRPLGLHTVSLTFSYDAKCKKISLFISLYVNLN